MQDFRIYYRMYCRKGFLVMENFFKTHKKVIYTFLCVIVFVVYTIYTAKAAFLSGRMGWEDEGHFWTMIKYCSVSQIFSLMKVEGHMLLWYLVVMPFAKLNFPYPYTMQIINWLFCTAALIVMWKKAPFNPFTKACIVFCPVFFKLYSVHARCYSIGVFFLFCACALYQERLKRPYLYFLILVLAANTSLQGLIGAAALGIPFLYELYKEYFTKRTSILPALVVTGVTALVGVMFYFQLFGAAVPDYEVVKQDLFLTNPLTVFLGISKGISLGILPLQVIEMKVLIVALAVLLAFRPKALFVWLFSFGTCALFFSMVYNPRPWHTAFFVVYLIMAFWIFELENPNAKLHKLMQLFAFVVLFAFLPVKVGIPTCRDFITPTFEGDFELRRGKVFTDIVPITLAPMLPRLNEKEIFIYDMHNRNLSSYEALMTYFDKDAKEFDVAEIKNYTKKKGSKYFLLTLDKSNKKFDLINKKMYIEGERQGIHYYIYEILPD